MLTENEQTACNESFIQTFCAALSTFVSVLWRIQLGYNTLLIEQPENMENTFDRSEIGGKSLDIDVNRLISYKLLIKETRKDKGER